MLSLRILGVMTGTSCDGLDAVCLEVSTGADAGLEWKPLWNASAPYPSELKKRVLRFQLPKAKTSALELLALNRDLGTWYGKTLSKMIASHDPKPQLIANHGQTVCHFPDEEVTLQLGDPARIAQVTGLSVISQFRTGDMAAGGQGAPLLPLFHKILGEHFANGRPEMEGIAIHNLGGISNLTYLGPQGSLYEVFAFDTGPANIWIDEAVSKVTGGKKGFDRNGALASKGSVDADAVKKAMKHPYFKRSVPKSTGRDDFPFVYFQKLTRARGNDLVATATAITVESIARAYEEYILSNGLPLSAIFLAGGGAKNKTLVDWLSDRMPSVMIQPISEAGFRGLEDQMIEPMGFALFAFLSLLGQPIGGTWTGVDGFGPPGQITPGENWGDVLSFLKNCPV
jgi:anhydro-N-acetylmuramic acid kinase